MLVGKRRARKDRAVGVVTPLLDVRGAAAMLGVSAYTLRGWVRQARIPFGRLPGGNGLLRFDADVLRQWVRDGGPPPDVAGPVYRGRKPKPPCHSGSVGMKKTDSGT